MVWCAISAVVYLLSPQCRAPTAAARPGADERSEHGCGGQRNSLPGTSDGDPAFLSLERLRWLLRPLRLPLRAHSNRQSQPVPPDPVTLVLHRHSLRLLPP